MRSSPSSSGTLEVLAAPIVGSLASSVEMEDGDGFEPEHAATVIAPVTPTMARATARRSDRLPRTTSPGEGVRATLEWADDSGSDPTAVVVALDRNDTLIVHPTLIDPLRIEGDEVGDRSIPGGRNFVGPCGIPHDTTRNVDGEVCRDSLPLADGATSIGNQGVHRNVRTWQVIHRSVRLLENPERRRAVCKLHPTVNDPNAFARRYDDRRSRIIPDAFLTGTRFDTVRAHEENASSPHERTVSESHLGR